MVSLLACCQLKTCNLWLVGKTILSKKLSIVPMGVQTSRESLSFPKLVSHVISQIVEYGNKEINQYLALK